MTKDFSVPPAHIISHIGESSADYYLMFGISYAIWSGVGIILISLAGWFLYGQTLDSPAIVGTALILLGVIVINLSSGSTVH